MLTKQDRKWLGWKMGACFGHKKFYHRVKPGEGNGYFASTILLPGEVSWKCIQSSVQHAHCTKMLFLPVGLTAVQVHFETVPVLQEFLFGYFLFCSS